jgi:hypothetical protein
MLFSQVRQSYNIPFMEPEYLRVIFVDNSIIHRLLMNKKKVFLAGEIENQIIDRKHLKN